MSKSTWEPRSVYLYVICIITLIMAIVATVQVVRSAVELAYPEPDSAIWAVKPVSPDSQEQMSEERLAQERELSRQRTVRYSVLSLVQNVAMLLISVPLYIYHWKQVRKTNPSTEQPSSAG